MVEDLSQVHVAAASVALLLGKGAPICTLLEGMASAEQLANLSVQLNHPSQQHRARCVALWIGPLAVDVAERSLK